jgi:hypothetical protein
MSIANLPDFPDDILNGVFSNGIYTPTITAISGVTGSTGPTFITIESPTKFLDATTFDSSIVLIPGGPGAYVIDNSAVEVFRTLGYTGAAQLFPACRLTMRRIGNWVDFCIAELSSVAATHIASGVPIVIYDFAASSNFIIPSQYLPTNANLNINIQCLIYDNNTGSRVAITPGVCNINVTTGQISFGNVATGNMANNTSGTQYITCGYSVAGA